MATCLFVLLLVTLTGAVAFFYGLQQFSQAIGIYFFLIIQEGGGR
jgi:hypothetical protein